jgi:hypothetical protein
MKDEVSRIFRDSGRGNAPGENRVSYPGAGARKLLFKQAAVQFLALKVCPQYSAIAFCKRWRVFHSC